MDQRIRFVERLANIHLMKIVSDADPNVSSQTDIIQSVLRLVTLLRIGRKKKQMYMWMDSIRGPQILVI